MKNRTTSGIVTDCLVLLAVLAAFAQVARAQGGEPLAAPSERPAIAAPELTAVDLEAYLDGMMPAQLARENIPGVVIGVVKDGKVLFAKGYGYADVARRRPVTADSTLFRVGSISKLFVWISVMQQVEQGKLDLDKDVNEYIDFKIPSAFGKPITLRNIMTHTTGFQEQSRDLWVDAQHTTPLGEYLKGHLPPRIFPPGVLSAYSNYASALAGYIVQRVSGTPFERYAAESILAPLGMERTTFVQPLSDDMAAMMSNGYLKGTGAPRTFEFVAPFPAGSVSATALDMCRFMIANLQDGMLEGRRILRPETARQMYSRIFGNDDRLNGMAHGFYEKTRNGHRIVGHGGATRYFRSELHLIQDANVGFFVSYNSAGKGEVNPLNILFRGFLDRYFPYTPPPSENTADPKADATQIAGHYKSSRRWDHSFMKYRTAAGSKVRANADGTLSVSTIKATSGEPVKFEEIAPFLYREINGQDRIGFKQDTNGRWQFQTDHPVYIYQKAGILENVRFNQGLLRFGSGLVLLTLVFWPVAAVVRKHYGRPLTLSREALRSRLLVRLVCVVFAVFLLVVLKIHKLTLFATTDTSTVLNLLSPWIVSAGILGVFSVLGTLYVCANAVRGLSTPGLWVWTKIHAVALALACVCLCWLAFYWNLLSFETHF